MKLTKAVERTAYHEAGHAVASYIMGIKFAHVTINSENDSYGHIHWCKDHFEKFRTVEYEISLKVAKRIEDEAMISFAGPIAEKICSGRTSRIGAMDDYRSVVDWVSYMIGPVEELEAYLRWLQIRTKNLMNLPQNQYAVKRLSEELLIHKQIGYLRAQRIIKTAIQDYHSSEKKK